VLIDALSVEDIEDISGTLDYAEFVSENLLHRD
jgi:hypothetical protein